MRSVRTRTREEWARRLSGNRRRFTFPGFQRAMQQMHTKGFRTPLPLGGPVWKKVPVIHQSDPRAMLVGHYISGRRVFDRCVVERVIGGSLDGAAGARRLADVGLAVLGCTDNMVEVLAAAPDEARLVNEARRRHFPKGIDIRHAIDAVLHIRRPGASRLNVNDDRRILAADAWLKKWSIRADDLLCMRRRVRLVSDWTYTQQAA